MEASTRLSKHKPAVIKTNIELAQKHLAELNANAELGSKQLAALSDLDVPLRLEVMSTLHKTVEEWHPNIMKTKDPLGC